MLEKGFMKNANGDVYKMVSVSEEVLTNKKVNAEFWDRLEDKAIQFYIDIAKDFGVSIKELNDLEAGKKLVETAYDILIESNFEGMNEFNIDKDL